MPSVNITDFPPADSSELIPRSGRRRQRIWFGNSFHTRRYRAQCLLRSLPSLAGGRVRRDPALFGGLVVGGAAWVQYKALRKSSALQLLLARRGRIARLTGHGSEVSNSAQEMYGSMKDTVTTTATSLWDGAIDIARQTRQGWDNTKEQVEVPDWLAKVLRIHEDVGTGQGGESGGQGGPEPPRRWQDRHRRRRSHHGAPPTDWISPKSKMIEAPSKPPATTR